MEQESSGRFVINLCSLATAITIPQPRASRLTRFSFFLSHHWEDGRRQYRLLMGYFSSVAEAEKWLATLKKVYPHAFVSEAPDAQPDLMSSTQALRILEIGQVRSDSHSPAHRREVNLATRGADQARQTGGAVETAAGKPRRVARTLEDTLEELRTSEFDMGADDELNSTGVRHLRIERDKVPGTSQRTASARTRK